MKTKALYYDFAFGAAPDSVNARLIEIKTHKGNPALLLDQTIFYPEGGGQPSDRGTINGVAVRDVLEVNGEILHLMESSVQNAGAEVKLALDMERRRDFSVQHSVQHLLSGTVLRLTGFPTVSMHLGDEYNTVDINAPALDPETTLRIEDEVVKTIEEDRPYIIHLCPPERVEDFPLRKVPPKGEEQIRVVEIGKKPERENFYPEYAIRRQSGEDFSADFSPCCGTHVSSTGQIGAFQIIGVEKYKGMTRMSFIAGRRCLKANRALRNNAVRISQLLSVPVEETGAAVNALLEKNAALEERIKALEDEEARRIAEALIARNSRIQDSSVRNAAGNGGSSSTPEPDVIVESFSGKDMEAILRIGKQAQKISGAIIVLGSEKDAKFAAVCAVKGVDIRPRFKSLVEAAGGKGGGGPTFFQGQFDSPDKYRRFLGELRKTQDPEKKA